MNSNYYNCLVEENDPSQPFYQFYWAYGSDPGAAIEKILDAAGAQGLENPVVCDITLFEQDMPEGEIESNAGRDIFWAKERSFFPPEPGFHLPVGVVGSGEEGELELDDIRPGYKIFNSGEPGRPLIIEVNADRDELMDLYAALIGLFEEIKVFLYIVHAYETEDESSEPVILVNEELNSPQKILEHLEQNRIDSIENGFVSLTTYIEEGATNINLSEHKKIIVDTLSEDILNIIVACLKQKVMYGLEDFVSVEFGVPHLHYIRPGARSRSGLMDHLQTMGFSPYDPGAEE